MTDADLLAQLADQEERLQFAKFDNETALALGQQLLAAARDRGLPVTISVRRNGQRLFHAALPGTSADNDAWIDRKGRVVDRYGLSSFRVQAGVRFERAALRPELRADQEGAEPVAVDDAALEIGRASCRERVLCVV